MGMYKIVSEATLDLTSALIDEYDIQVIPMELQMGEESYRYHPNEEAITCKEFYEKLRGGAEATTSQINPVVYKEFLEPLLKEGNDILYIAFSSGLSGTYNTGRMMIEDLKEKYPERKIECVDSLSASIGEGLTVLYAARMRKEGASFEEVTGWVKENCTKACHWFTVDDLFHLKRGGRVSTVEAAVGTVLRVKPVLSVDADGKLTVVAKVRGLRKGLDYLKERLMQDGIQAAEQTVIVGHADNLEAAETLKELLLSEGLVKEVLISNIGPVIGTHTGAGMVALTFFGENYKF